MPFFWHACMMLQNKIACFNFHTLSVPHGVYTHLYVCMHVCMYVYIYINTTFNEGISPLSIKLVLLINECGICGIELVYEIDNHYGEEE